MNNAENTDAASLEILQTICENCEICIKNKRLRPRPVVGLPLASGTFLHDWLDLQNVYTVMPT
jgi:hypothetical protein